MVANTYSAALAAALCAAVLLVSVQHSDAGGFGVSHPIDGVVMFRDRSRADGANVDCTPPEGEHDASIYETTTDDEGEFSLPDWAANPHPVNDPPGVVSTVCTASVVVNGTTFTGSVSLVIFVADENGLSGVVIYVDRTTVEANDASVGSASFVDLFDPEQTVQGIVMGEDDETVVMIRDAPKPVVMSNAVSQIQRIRNEENIHLKNTTLIVSGKCCSSMNGKIRLTNASNLSFEQSVSLESNGIEVQDGSLLRFYANADVTPNVREMGREVEPCAIGRFSRVQTDESSVTNFEIPLWIQRNGTFSATEGSTVNFRPSSLPEGIAQHLNYGPVSGPVIVNDGEFSAIQSSTVNIQNIPILGFGNVVVGGSMNIDYLPEGHSSAPRFVNNWNVTWGGSLNSNHRLISPNNCSSTHGATIDVDAPGRMMVGDTLRAQYGGRINISTTSFVAGNAVIAGDDGHVAIGRFSGSSFDGSSVQIGIAPIPESPSRRRLHTSFSVLFGGNGGENYHVDDDDYFEPVYSPGRFGSSVAVSNGGSIAISGMERASVSQGGISVHSGSSLMFTNISTIAVDVTDLYVSDGGSLTLNTLDTLDESSFVNTGKAFFSNGARVHINNLHSWSSGTWSGSGTTAVDGSFELSSSASVSLTAGRFSASRSLSVESGGRFALRSNNVTVDETLKVAYSGVASIEPLEWNNGSPMFPSTVNVNTFTTDVADDDDTGSWDFRVSQSGQLSIGPYDSVNITSRGAFGAYEGGAVYVYARTMAVQTGRFSVQYSGEAELECEGGGSCTFESRGTEVSDSSTLIFANISYWDSGNVDVSNGGMMDLNAENVWINGTLDIYSGGRVVVSGVSSFGSSSISVRDSGSIHISEAPGRALYITLREGSNLTVSSGSSLVLGARQLEVNGNLEAMYGANVLINATVTTVGGIMSVYDGSSFSGSIGTLVVNGPFAVGGSSSVNVEAADGKNPRIQLGSSKCQGSICPPGRFSVVQSSSVSLEAPVISIEGETLEVRDSSSVDLYVYSMRGNVGTLTFKNVSVSTSGHFEWICGGSLGVSVHNTVDIVDGGGFTINSTVGRMHVEGNMLVHRGAVLNAYFGVGDILVDEELASFDGGYVELEGYDISIGGQSSTYNGGGLKILGRSATTGGLHSFQGGDIRINTTRVETIGDLYVSDSGNMRILSGSVSISSGETEVQNGGEFQITSQEIFYTSANVTVHDGGSLSFQTGEGNVTTGPMTVYNGGSLVVNSQADFDFVNRGSVAVYSSGTVNIESSRASLRGCGQIYNGGHLSILTNSSIGISPENEPSSFSWVEDSVEDDDDGDYCGDTPHFLTVFNSGSLTVVTPGQLALGSERGIRVHRGGVVSFETAEEIHVHTSNISVYSGQMQFTSSGGIVNPTSVQLSGGSTFTLTGSDLTISRGSIEMVESSTMHLGESTTTCDTISVGEGSRIVTVNVNVSISSGHVFRGGSMNFTSSNNGYFQSNGLRVYESGSFHFEGGSVELHRGGLRVTNSSVVSFGSSDMTIQGGDMQFVSGATLRVLNSEIIVTEGSLMMNDYSTMQLTDGSVHLAEGAFFNINSTILVFSGLSELTASSGGTFNNSELNIGGGNVIFSDSSVVIIENSELTVSGGSVSFGNGATFRASQGTIGAGTILTLKGENFALSDGSDMHIQEGGVIRMDRGGFIAHNGSMVTGVGSVQMTGNSRLDLPTSNLSLSINAYEGSTVDISAVDQNNSVSINGQMRFAGSFFTVNADFINVEGGSVELQDASSLTIEPFDDADYFTYSQHGSVLSVATGATFGSSESHGDVLLYGVTVQTRAFENGDLQDNMDFHVHNLDMDRETTMLLDYGSLHLSGALRPRMGPEGMRIHSLRTAAAPLDDGQPLVEVVSAAGDEHEPFGEIIVTAGTTMHLADNIDNNNDEAPDALRCGHLVVETGATVYLHGIAVDCMEYTLDGQLVDVA